MKKHVFTIRWERKRLTAYPVFEFYRAFDWPDNIPSGDVMKIAAKIRGEDIGAVVLEHINKLPQDCKDMMNIMPGLYLRARYSPETEGPYMISDPDGSLTEEQILTFVTYREGGMQEFRV